MRSDNKTGFIGVRFDARRNKFCAAITAYKKEEFLGYFDSANDAHNAYIKRKSQVHSFSPILGEHQYG